MPKNSERSDSIEIQQGLSNISINVPTSKSHANRMLVLASITKNPVTIYNLPKSTDVQTMLKCLQSIGLQLKISEKAVEVLNSFPECETGDDLVSLETGDGGTTNRFLMPLLARGKKKYQMNMAEPMRVRPMDDLTNPLKAMGICIKKNTEGFSVQGPYKNLGLYDVESEKSTQFASGILMGVSDIEGYQINAKNIQYSEKYFRMTEDLIEQFKKTHEFHVPVDASSLAYAVAAGLTLKKIIVPVCKEIDRYQADSAVFDILEQMEGNYSFNHGILEVWPSEKLKSFKADCGDFPDLVPTLAYLASYAEGTSVLSNLEVLTHKESDRFLEIKKQLKLFGIQFDEIDFTLSIHGSKEKRPAVKYKAPDDHRMIMTTALHMMRNSGGEIENWKHVSKSFPDFFKEFR